jgi:S-adenosylmethionine synthetase
MLSPRRAWNLSDKLFTSESVTDGHPDKVADQIADAVLDAVLTGDPDGRVACECALTTGLVVIIGEVTTSTYVEVPKIARDVIKDIGYDGSDPGFDYRSCGVVCSIDEQSPDIARGVDPGGAGDQGMMFGFACDETPELMPAPIQLAHQLARRLSTARKNGMLPWARPDGKTQVTVEYGEDGRPQRVDTVLVSVQHDDKVSNDQIHEDVQKLVVEEIIPEHWLDAETKRLVNPTGRFVHGGPAADSGLTGRKIIVDTYGGYARHGGGSFSGKDPTKVDRSAAYGARWLAKNLVAAGVCTKLELQLAYAIGVTQPVSVSLETFGTERVSAEQILSVIRKNFDLSVKGLIQRLDLRRPIYARTAAFGHFGRTDIDVPWEKTSQAAELARELGTDPMLMAAAG